MKEKYTVGTRWSWNNDNTTYWKIVGYDGSGKDRYVWIEQEGSPDQDRIHYTEKEFDEIVREGKFKRVGRKQNNLKRSHLLNFMKSMYTLGQMDWGKVGGTVTRTPEEIETLFNEFLKEQEND